MHAAKYRYLIRDRLNNYRLTGIFAAQTGWMARESFGGTSAFFALTYPAARSLRGGESRVALGNDGSRSLQKVKFLSLFILFDCKAA